MTQNGFARLPIVDRQGKLVGIVTRTNLLRAFLRPDEEIRDELMKEVLERYLWQDISLLRVETHEGVVELSGELNRRSLVRWPDSSPAPSKASHAWPTNSPTATTTRTMPLDHRVDDLPTTLGSNYTGPAALPRAP